MWEEVMGIHVENQILAPSGSMTEKLQLAIGSNDIPDFAIVDATMMASLIKNDMVEDMTDVYETWATDDLKQLTEQNDKGLFAPVTNSDGRYMGIPVHTIRYGNNHCILPVVCKCDNHYLQYHARTYLSYQIRHGISGMVHAYGIDLDARRIKIPPASGSALLSTCHPVLYYSHALPSSGTLLCRSGTA